MGRRSRWLLLGSIATLVVAMVALVLVRGDDGQPATTTTTSAPSSSSATSRPSTSSTEPSSTAPVTTPPPTTAVPSTTVPPWTGVATVTRQGPTSRPVVALTFDAGSDLGYASAILDTLAANGIRASFGLTGDWTVEHPEVVARMAREGHQLVNHTWSHPSFTGYSTGTAPLPTAERIAELTRAEAAIVDASGVAAEPWFRPPYGDYDQSVLVDVGSIGYRFVAMWTIDSLGWNGLSASEITTRCLDGAEPGAIYLFHVGSASADHAALQAIIDGLRARGYGFATLAGLVDG
ncbi:MAG: polysaccharide deacetylase family protein [Actinomycetota bacterium]